MTGIIIQARVGSSRLPGKIFMKLSGNSMLWHVLKRCQQAKLANTVVIATTTKKNDDKVEKFCKKNHVLCFRGDSNNVLARYHKAAEKFQIDTIVRITSDCPLIDSTVIDACIKEFLKKNYDYVSNLNPKRTLPRGLDVEVFSFTALKKAYLEAKKPYEKEHVTPYIWENSKNEFSVGSPVNASGIYKRNYRLTVDYPEDFKLMRKIYQKFYKVNKIIDVKKVILFLDNNPKVASINSDLEQKTLK